MISTYDLWKPLPDASSNDAVTSAWDEYGKTAKRIAETYKQECDNIVETLLNLPPETFAYIGGSSGVGKTQIALTLLLERSNDFGCVLYFFSHIYGTNTQNIYRFFYMASKCLRLFAKRDMEDLGNPGVESFELDKENLRDRKLFVCGFLCYLLEQKWDGKSRLSLPTNFTVQRCRPAKLVALMTRDYVGKKPLILLDEFQPQTAPIRKGLSSDANYYRFLRNVLLVSQFKVAVTGTHSTVANMGDIAENSRGAGVWCTVLNHLPKYAPLPPYSEPDTLVHKIAMHSRPWFTHLFVKFLQEEHVDMSKLNTDSLLCIAQKICAEVLQQKMLSSKFGGRRGQVCQFVAAHYYFNDELCVHQHFGVFCGPPCNIALDSSMRVFGISLKDTGAFNPDGFPELHVGTKWKAESRIPIPREDLLLHLCLSGIPGSGCIFDENGEAAHLAKAVEEISQVSRKENCASRIICTNPDQAVNDGMFMEMLASASICKASHAAGFGGISVKDFAANVLYELTGTQSSTFNWAPITNLECLKDWKVGFMSPPNSEWPLWLRDIPGSHFTNCARPQNFKQVDFVATVLGEEVANSRYTLIDRVVDDDDDDEEDATEFITGEKFTSEFKDEQGGTHSHTMWKILKNIEQGRRFHLVIVKKLGKTFFKEYEEKDEKGREKRQKRQKRQKRSMIAETFRKEFPNIYASKCCFFRLNSKGLFTSVDGIQNAKNPQGLVLFVEAQP